MASSLIKESREFKTPVTESFLVNLTYRGYYSEKNNEPVVDALLALGYLEKRDLPESGLEDWLTLTAKGTAAFKDTHGKPQDGKKNLTFQMGNIELVEVTGIAALKPGFKEAQFKWRLSFTALGKELSGSIARIHITGDGRVEDRGVYADEIRDSRAILRLYDDGWRLESMSDGYK